MPSDNAQAQQQLRGHRSSSSILSQTSPTSPSSPHPPSTTPPTAAAHHRPKGHKHVVSAGRTHHTHSRTASGKQGGPKPNTSKQQHAHDTSSTDMRKLLNSRNSSSATNIRKNTPHANLRRNRSSADVPKKARDNNDHPKRPVSVHFELGDLDKDKDNDDGWEEASSTASPTLSRSASRSAASSIPSSARPSAANSQAQSPVQASSHAAAARAADSSGATGPPRPNHSRTSTDGKIITERLLQRTPSYNTTKMSLATATPTSAGYLPDDMSKSQESAGTSTKVGSKDEVVSRFVGGSGTPSDGSPFLRNRKTEMADEDVKRVRSMGNLGLGLGHEKKNNINNNITKSNDGNGNENARDDDDEDESALLRRPRQSHHAYIPPQQSRTQQKLWLQRASSNISPPQPMMSGPVGLHGRGVLGAPPVSLVDADDDGSGRDPRTRIQLERTGLEYLVVRRHQDPVGAALRRLERVNGGRRMVKNKKGEDKKEGEGKFGLSQSLKDPKVRVRDGEGRVGFDGRKSEEGDEGVTTLLRSLWEKNFDLSASAE